MATNPTSVTPETLITIKISLNDVVKKLKLPLRDLTAATLPAKLRTCLNIGPENSVLLERYSDSMGGFIMLSETNTPAYKALIRAAKAKGKLRLKASVIPPDTEQEQEVTQFASDIPNMVADLPQSRRGNGIFQYREARASQHTLVNDEAPVPKPFVAQMTSDEYQAARLMSVCHDLAFRTRGPAVTTPATPTAWSVYCNICDVAMVDAHYHCSICDGGDYDLCEKCVSLGKSCPGDDHWLIKRFIKDGKVVTSTTERVAKKTPAPAIESTMPGAFTEESKATIQEPQDDSTRTCNNCVIVLPDSHFVTCKDCDDFDLCRDCLSSNHHGHHPGHSFTATTAETVLSGTSQALLNAGRNVEHSAYCDGCDKKIFGVRHKCLQCPDWDYCAECVKTASSSHPRHRFAALYDPLVEPQRSLTRHFGIFCDGPLCNKHSGQNYIQGVRYKCAVCHDTDFCAACEALPTNHHNRSHPLIKFTTAVRNASITTINEDVRGNVRNMGDKPAVRIEPQNAAIPVRTVAEITPTEEKTSRRMPQPMDGDFVSARTAPVVPMSLLETKSVLDILATGDEEKTSRSMPQPLDGDVISARTAPVVPASLLNATFVRDSIADGTVVAPGSRFTQIWTLRNEGPHAWPAGCSVRFVGGDNMLNVDNGRPAPVSMIAEAVESSVVAREVQVGEEIAFRITLKAPLREGKSISYWRLKAADGTPFGHRLWCDIEVRNSKSISAPSQVPAFAPAASQQDERSSLFQIEQSRAHALRQHQLRLLHRQQMLRHATSAGLIDVERQARDQVSVPSSIEDDYVRKQTATARMDAIRSRILESRMANLKAYAAVIDRKSAKSETVESKEQPIVPVEQPVVPVVQPIVPVVVEQETEKVEEENIKSEVPSNSASSSQMIFPKLDKESPASSMIGSTKGKAAYVETEEGEIEQSAVPQSPSTVAETLEQTIEDDDELELLSVSAASDDENDDGFLTDEEYDILDASDRETVASP